jgi:hypothetical protein
MFSAAIANKESRDLYKNFSEFKRTFLSWGHLEDQENAWQEIMNEYSTENSSAIQNLFTGARVSDPMQH